MIITIDGPAGSGKSSVAKLLAKKLNALYLDTGAMYRSVTLTAMDSGINLDDAEAVIKIADEIEITFKNNGDFQETFIDGQNKSKEIRTKEVDSNVSKVASIKAVREKMVSVQREMAVGANTIVAEGRDIGSVVFPESKSKFYITADARIRAKRRADERGEELDDAKVAEIVDRDEIDITRKESPLKIPEGAKIIDNSNLTIDQTVAKVINCIA